MYCLRLIESALEDVMDDGWGKHFKQFTDEEKQEVINAVIEAFDNDGMFILRDKYVIPGKSGVLSAEDFKITEWQPIETAPKNEQILMLMKHGVIEGQWDGDVGSGYYGRPMEWYATHWMPVPEKPAEYRRKFWEFSDE